MDYIVQTSMINFNSVVFRSDTSLFFNDGRKDIMYFGARINDLMNPANWDKKDNALLLDRLNFKSLSHRAYIKVLLKFYFNTFSY